MTHCFRCDADKMPVAEMQQNGVAKFICPTCAAPLVPDEDEPEAAKHQEPTRERAPKAQAKDIVSMVRERREMVAKRIEELRGLEAELAQLDAMLRAVDSPKESQDETVPVLRPVRAAR